MPKRGAFIVVEGLNRSGKTTQTSLLYDHLESSGISVKLLKFPGNQSFDFTHTIHAFVTRFSNEFGLQTVQLQLEK